MSAKDMLYGIVSMVVPNCTGLDGGTYTGYLVDVNLFTDPLMGNSIKGTTFSVGDVVTIIQCGESLAFGGTDVPMHGWAFCEYSYSYPSVYQVPNAALARSICTDPRYSASVSMNWICRHSGAVDSLYWPGRITAISGSTVTVCDQFGAGAYQMPVSSDLSIGDFSVGDYVLVYSPTSGEQVIGWWQMEPGSGMFWNITISLPPMEQAPHPIRTLAIFTARYYDTVISSQSMGITFSNFELESGGGYFSHPLSYDPMPGIFTLKIQRPSSSWPADMWPLYAVYDQYMTGSVRSIDYNIDDGTFSNI